MDPTSREDLSALMDGELAAEPTRFLLRRLDHDPELGATWSRWHLIRACLASDSARMSAQRSDNDFAAGIAAALEADTVPQTRSRHWARYLGGGAIAASVAVAALMLNVPASRVDAPAPVAQDRPVSNSNSVDSAVATTGLATASRTADAAVPPWLLSRQPTVFGAQPASANVVYGTGLMQPDYLQRATYARDTAPYASFQASQPRLPFSIVLLPEQPPSSATVSPH